MLNVKYHKDLNHNFLIINHKLDEKDQNYQYRMISGNKIGHLLNCKIRYVDFTFHAGPYKLPVAFCP